MVLVTALQLGLVVVVWLLALIPAAIAALTVLSFKAVRGALRKAPAVLPPLKNKMGEDGR
ncbi:hypothetical protein [Caulobacter sp.]|uniref:hypothetical protein n=1 Tax=Caulobacter sp. TaxID=78 RepID=UPI0025C547A5|nr:hypothetical protein [Caulobacter sp.]